MKTMGINVREEICNLWNENRNKQLSLDKVIKTTCDYIVAAAKKNSCSAEAMMFLSILGDEKKNHQQRGQFRKEVLNQMPHCTFNGDKQITVVDWQEVSQAKAKESTLAMSELRLFVGEQSIVLKDCIAFATVKRELPKMQEFTLTYETGYKETIRKEVKGKDGKKVTEERVAYYMPRKKTVWGYTDDVRDAIIRALEVMCE